ncbi:MAG: uroporphyrinogen decarboxylase [Myxococcales bacterium]|nr:uroporphyrinogen decarboxylase [Myxococcales bacterium]
MSETYRSETFLQAARGLPVEKTPIWVMRQAGRYLPEYRAVRQKASFRDLTKTPELAAEVTLQPLRRYDLDAGIIFSDILVVTEAMGVPFEIVKGTGPVMERTIRSADDVDTLREVDAEEQLPELLQAIRLVVGELGGRVPLLGFAGAPFTLACYLVEGGPSKDFARMRRLMHEAPDLAKRLINKIADAVANVLRAQVLAGASAVQLFDTWAAVLSPAAYREFTGPANNRILASLEDLGVPRIMFVGNTGAHFDSLRDAPAEMISVDWRTDLSAAVDKLGDRYSLQGNLEPTALFLPPDRLREAAKGVLEVGRGARGHVFNLGHGILPQVDPEHLGVLVDAVHELSVR